MEPRVERFVFATFIGVHGFIYVIIDVIRTRCDLFPIFVKGESVAFEYDFGLETFTFRV